MDAKPGGKWTVLDWPIQEGGLTNTAGNWSWLKASGPQIPAGLPSRFVHKMSLIVLLTMDATVGLSTPLLAPISMPDKTLELPIIVFEVMLATGSGAINMAPRAALGTLPKC